MNRPLFLNDTIDSIQRHREVGRAKDLSAPPRKTVQACNDGCKFTDSLLGEQHTLSAVSQSLMDGFSEKFAVFVLTIQTLKFNFISVGN